MQTIESSSLEQLKALEENSKAQELIGKQLRKDKEQLTTKNKHENTMRCSSLNGACFSPTQNKDGA